MSVVASVAINVDSRDAAAKLRQFQQQSTAAGRAAEQLQHGTTAAGQAAQGAGRQFQTAANGLKYYIDATGRARKENGQFVSTAEAAAAGIEKQGKAASAAAGAMRSLGGVIASIGAGALVAGMVRGAVAAEQLQLRLKVLSAEYGETARIQQFVSDSAKTFGQSQTEAAAGVADVYARLRPLGISLDKIETVYKGFNATALASGTSAEAASGAFLQLSQALGSGRLQGDEFSSVAEQVPGILRLVAGEMGVTVGELKKLGSEGKITSDILINALAKGFDENSSKIKALLDQSPAQRFKEFKDSTQALSNALGSELLPAIVPIVQQATELLRLFGSLPGPVKTLAAAVLGVTAAFVALAPAISAVIGLLGPAGIAGLIAAGPWIALAAGIGAATVALAGYRTESQKLSQSVGAAARGGGPANLARARNRAVELQQEISLAEQQQRGRAGGAGGGRRGVGQRSAAGTGLAAKRAELAQLQRDIAQGRQAAAVTTPVVPAGATAPTGAAAAAGGGRKGGGKSEADKAAEAAKRQAEELKRSYELGTQLGTQFSRQLLLLDAATDQERRRLQIQFDYQDREKQISELKSKTQQANLRDLSKELERLQLRELDLEYLREQLNIFERIAGIDLSKTAELGKRAFAGAGGAFDPSLPDLRVSPAEQQMAKYREELAALTNPINMAVTGADAIGNAFGQVFQDIATGAKSTQEALADAFKGIGEAFIQMATQIIAKQLAMIAFQGILRALGGGGGGFSFSGAGPAALPSGDGFAAGFSMPKLYAEGGYVTGPTQAVVGEGGQPEYIIPASKMRGAMQRYASGARGAAVIPGNGESGGGGGGTATAAPIDVRYTVERINSVDYVTADQFQRGMAQAAEQGARQGERRALYSLRQNTNVRKSIGV